MPNKLKRFLILIFIVLSVAIVYLESNYYRRMTVPKEIQNIEVDSYDDFIYEFLSIMLPDYEILYLDFGETWTCSPDQNKCIIASPISGIRSIILLHYDEEIWISFDDFQRVISFEGIKMYHEGKLITKNDCGPLANGKECYTYRTNFMQTCYMTAINGQFSAQTWIGTNSYCPKRTYFDNKADQIANYIFDGFMKLNIPYEFSNEYQRSLEN